MNRYLIPLITLLFTTAIHSEEAAKLTLKSRDISVAEAAELIQNNKDLIILDIRTPGEYKAGHIQGAQLINFIGDDFDAKISKLPKDKPYLVHCASGGRSGRALAKFKEKGFQSVLHLKAGFMGWEKAGKPVVK